MNLREFLKDALTDAGPLIDRSNATNVQITELVSIGRRIGKPWYLYNGAKEIHFAANLAASIQPFDRIADAYAYLWAHGNKLGVPTDDLYRALQPILRPTAGQAVTP